jgi:hypothetical protein
MGKSVVCAKGAPLARGPSSGNGEVARLAVLARQPLSCYLPWVTYVRPASLVILPAALLLMAASGPAPVAGGRLSTLDLGRYACEMPDPVDVTRGRPIEGSGFNVVNASSYRDGGMMGSYLRTGDTVVMTSGVRKGERYRVAGRGILQRTERSGADARERCVSVGSRKR